MIKQLPHGISLNELERQAEKLAGQLALGDGNKGRETLRRQARHSVATDYGFVTWPQLLLHLRCIASNGDSASDFLELACLNYTLGDHPSRWAEARAMLENDPTLASQDLYHACCLGDVAMVATLLDEDISGLDRRGGPFDWEPLMYACYSRLNLAGYSTSAVVDLLLDRGADPNPYFMWGGQYKFTALTGVFGEGEGGPANHPPHQDYLALARRLLEAGADANDSQALYNRMFTEGSQCLELLLEFGLNADHTCNWLVEDGQGHLLANQKQVLQYQLSWAVGNHHADRARLLVEHGADVATPEDGVPFYKKAMKSGNVELAEFLVAHGAPRVDLEPSEEFACVCMTADKQGALELLQKYPDLMQQLQDDSPGLLHEAVGADRLDAVRLMAELGADLNLQVHNAPLHEAAWNGSTQMTRLLVEFGADITLRDHGHQATPLQWAHFRGQNAVVEYLASLEIDIFDAVVCENLERIAEILAADVGMLETTYGQVRTDKNPFDFDWKTPLASAVTRKCESAVKFLLDHGANPHLSDPRGRSLLDLAKAESTAEIVAVLEIAMKRQSGEASSKD